ncbi:hypothetical protein [Psychromonas sp. MME1]|uniref:hypothetical protein n=1 Tax=Psychromonas sp. MME1 TaxID=3231032 RepID=UPI0034E2FCE7
MKLHPLVLALGLTPLVGCGGGSSSSDNATATSYSVYAIDGYLRNAQVWLDLNGNYQLDLGEPEALSGEGGLTILDTTNISNPEQYSVVVKAIAAQTIDEDTVTVSNPNGIAITTPFLLSAPAGQTVISPLSTLVKIKMDNGQDQQQAMTAVATELGIVEDALLGDYIAANQGDIAAKANAVVELGVLPESEQKLQEISQDNSNLDEQLTTHLETVKVLTEEQRLVKEEDGSITVATKIDTDDDGVIDDKDAFPTDASEWLDSDKDGMGNNSDAFPNDATETVDTDKDGVGDNSDAFPNDATETVDTDKDGMGDNSDAFPNDATETVDSDQDGVGDNSDAFPNDATETVDTDKDGMGDNSDAFPNDATETVDSDQDGVGDNSDAFPNNATESADTDKDGMGDNSDAFPNDASETVDSDQDGVGDNSDAFPNNATESADTDKDGIGDNSDAFPNDASETVDSDQDGVGDNSDAFPNDATENADTDQDGIGDNSDAYANDPDKSVLDTFSNKTYTTPFIHPVFRKVTIVAVNTETYIQTFNNGDIQTATMISYTALNGVHYGHNEILDLLKTDGSFNRISAWKYDFNLDGNAQFIGAAIDIGNEQLVVKTS